MSLPSPETTSSRAPSPWVQGRQLRPGDRIAQGHISVKQGQGHLAEKPASSLHRRRRREEAAAGRLAEEGSPGTDANEPHEELLAWEGSEEGLLLEIGFGLYLYAGPRTQEVGLQRNTAGGQSSISLAQRQAARSSWSPHWPAPPHPPRPSSLTSCSTSPASCPSHPAHCPALPPPAALFTHGHPPSPGHTVCTIGLALNCLPTGKRPPPLPRAPLRHQPPQVSRWPPHPEHGHQAQRGRQ